MNTRILEDTILQRIRQIHELSKKYNDKCGKNHLARLLELMSEHTAEIESLHSKNNPHYITETGDLIILCFEALMESGVSIDETIYRCFERYEAKLPKLINES